MTDNILVRHPQPLPGESLSGYILRVSEENGYMHPGNLFRVARIAQSERATRNFSFDKLAATINWQSQSMRESDTSLNPADLRVSKKLRDSFRFPELAITVTKFCPRCVVEKGFIETHWSSPLMVGCPTHQCVALYNCPNCRKPLGWFRPGLLECKCGGDLRRARCRPIPPSEATLLAILRSKLLGSPFEDENLAGLPAGDLMRMNLQGLSTMVRVLARIRMLSTDLGGTRDDRKIVNEASMVLADWPNNFVHLIRAALPTSNRTAQEKRCHN
jgi:hypothetical protein